ncbi:MAG: inorganic phosphate transporter [Bacilli bacterium]
MIWAFLLLAMFQAISGWNDGGNLLGLFQQAVPKPWLSFALLVVGIALGPLILGAGVAHTIGRDIIVLKAGDLYVLNEALIATLITLTISWFIGMPTSTSLALVGGLMGTAWVSLGLPSIHWHGFFMTVLSVGLSITLGFFAGAGLYRVERRVRNASERAWRPVWIRLSYLLAFIQGVAYGANDAEKALGLAALLLLISHRAATFAVTPAIILASLGVWMIGCVVGGQRIAKTVGGAFYQLKPKHVVSIQAGAAVVVVAAAALGGPVSTTQTLGSALIGVGHTLRHQRVNRSKATLLFTAWGLTLPVAMLVGAITAGIAAGLSGLHF